MGKIHHLSIDIKLPSDTPQSGALDLAGKYVKDYFIPAIDSAVTEFDSAEDVVIPLLEIDLGSLALSDVPEQLEAALREELIRSFPVADSIPVAGSSSIYHDTPLTQTSQSQGISSQRAVFGLFLEYLSNGYADFHPMEDAMPTDEIGKDVIGLIKENPSERARLIDTIRRHYPFSFYRLESFLLKDSLSEIIDTLLGGKAEVDSPIGNRVSSPSDLKGLSMLSIQYVMEREILGLSKSEGILGGIPDDLQRNLLTNTFGQDQKESATPNDNQNDLLESGSSQLMNTNSRRAEYLYSLVRKVLSHVFHGIGYLDDGMRRFLNENLQKKLDDIHSLDDLTEERLTDFLLQVEEELGPLDLEVKLAKRIHTDDAGLVILHPFYRMVFSRLGLTDEQDAFISLDARLRAAHLLKCIADGPDTAHNDNDMLFCKLLCGVPSDYPTEPGFVITEAEREEIEALYASVLNYWNPFKSDSYESMRMAFIKRGGTVEKDDSSFIVRVAGSAVDILMDDLPWEISMIYLPWTEPFFVEWQKEF